MKVTNHLCDKHFEAYKNKNTHMVFQHPPGFFTSNTFIYKNTMIVIQEKKWCNECRKKGGEPC